MKKNIIILIVFIGVIVAWSYLRVDELNKITDCGDDLNCFIEESKNCDLAKVNYTAKIKMFGVEQTVVSFLEIKGTESEKCLFYTKAEKLDLKFSNELIEEMLAKGLTQQEIEQQEQESKDLLKDQEGLIKICKFNISDLTEMLIRWERGSFFGEDCELAAESCIEE